MKKTSKRFLSLLLTLLLLLGTVSFGFCAAAQETTAYAAGDIIEYGTYPQSLVTDEELLAVLPQILGEQKTFNYYGNEIGTGANIGNNLPFEGMTYVDVVYQNVKYRGVTIDAYRPFTTPGGQESGSCQEENGYLAGNTYWFRFEPLRWRVLNPDTGLVMCDTLIDSQPFAVYRNAMASSFYTGEYGSITDSNHSGGWWETISVWLNDHFLTTAFSASQQENILAEEIANDYWYVGSGAGGNGAHRYDAPKTADKIYLPAWDDLCLADFGFNTNGRAADNARALTGTDYAKAQGLMVSETGAAEWWTRTVSRYYNMNYDCVVSRSGAMSSAPANLKDYNAYYGVCPAMRMVEIQNDAAGDALLHVGDLIHFGSYPQSRETDAAVISALNERLPFAPQKNLTISEYRWSFDADYYTDYADLIVDGQKYRAKIEYTVMIREYTGSSTNVPQPKVYSDYDYTYTDGETEKYVYYYKFEPLTWRILDVENGLLMCNDIIEALVYQHGNYYDDYWGDDGWADEARTHYATDYTVSHIRDFLINDFWNTAFNDAQRAKILTTVQDNRGMMTLRGETGYERYDWETTSDKVFLLSSAEALNPDYGFNNETRKLQYTEYALEDHNSNDNYWVLRNAAADGFYGRRPCGVFPSGSVGFLPGWSNDMHGVVPAVYVAQIENEVSGGAVVCSTHVPAVVPVTLATCTEAGVGNEICAVCGEVLCEDVVIPALGHDCVPHEGKAPTCKDAGWAAYETCSRCDYTTYQVIAATGIHTPGEAAQENVVGATCTVPGSYDNVIHCTVCGELISRETVTSATIPHTPGEAAQENVVAATCTRAGSYDSVVRCEVCGKELSRETVSTPVSDHTPGAAAQENVVAATCTADGSYDEVVRCKDCGTVLSRTTKTTPKTGHAWNGGAVTTPPTCTSAGIKTFSCTNCSATRTESVAATGHAWGGWTTTKQSTCTAEGQQTRTCTRDGSHMETRPIAKTAHTDDGSGHCRTCGADLQASQRCKYCGKIHTGPFAWLIKFFHSILALFKR